MIPTHKYRSRLPDPCIGGFIDYSSQQLADKEGALVFKNHGAIGRTTSYSHGTINKWF